MRAAREPLTFEVLDDLVLAHERSRAPAARLQPGPSLGALIELLRFCDDHPGALAYLPSPEIDALKRSLEIRKPAYPLRHREKSIICFSAFFRSFTFC